MLDEEDMQDEPSGVPAVANDPNKLVMDHVQFGYTPDALLLKDYNLHRSARQSRPSHPV